MLKTIKKRDGREVPFDVDKITNAIHKAIQATGGESRQLALELSLEVIKALKKKMNGHIFGVEEIQDMVEKVLIESGQADIAKAYILYRAKRSRVRDGKSELMDILAEIIKETSRENANVSNSPSAKILQIAEAASKKFYLSRIIPDEMAQAHRDGDIHIHDLGFYGKTCTCIQIPLARLLKEGFDNGHGYIRPPKRAQSAAAQTAVILQSSQNDMHGGQSYAALDRDLAPYFEDADEETCYQASEALIYNLNSLHSRAGGQVPFSSLNVGTETSDAARKVIRNILLAYEAGLGHGENPIFPNIIFRLQKGVNMSPGDPNYDLFQLAVRVASKRLNPTFSFMDSSFNKEWGDQVAYMGCRSRVMANRRGPAVTDGRGNLSFTSINLPRLAVKAGGNVDIFYQLLDGMMDLVIRQLYHRFCVQAKLRVKDMPFVMGQGLYLNSQGLKVCDPVEPAIVNGTLSMGFIGLAETLKMLTGKHHGESKEAQELGLQIVAYMKERIDRACEEYNLNFTLLATPAEGLSGRFLGLDRDRFGTIEGVTDKEFYTNSFHVPVNHQITGMEKVSLEGPYHQYCNAGHISYVEMDAPPVNNPEAVETIIRYMADSNMGYAGINYPVDFCTNCKLVGVINDATCPRCGSGSIRRVRRITGYLAATSEFSDAKRAELVQRKIHF